MAQFRVEPDGPLAPDERRRAQQALGANHFLAYKHYRDKQAVTWIAQRLGLSPKRIRDMVGDAQETLGYERAYAKKQSTPGRYTSVAERQAERRRAYITWANELSEDEWLVLCDNLPRRVVQALDQGLAQAATEEEKLDIQADLLLPHVKAYLRRLGRYFSSSDEDYDPESGESYALKRGDTDPEWTGFVDDMGLPEGTRPSDLPLDDARAGLDR